jgi:hypothetical protein
MRDGVMRDGTVREQGPVAVPAARRPANLRAGSLSADSVRDGAPADGGPAAPRRSTARQLLEAALAGVGLGSRDRQFLTRLVHWDKRNAASVASLLERAREAGRAEGRAEAGLTPRQLELVVAALGDAAVYRASGAAAASCWDCEMVRGRRCADHAREFDRARAYAELASAQAGPCPGPAVAAAAAELPPPPRDIASYRRRASVAS